VQLRSLLLERETRHCGVSTSGAFGGPDDGYGSAMSQKPLAIYLQDHLAGSTAGVNLARRFVKSHSGTRAGRTLTEVGAEIEADRETLLRLMAELGVPPSRAKNAAAWVTERVARLKPNGRLSGQSALQGLHELETLSLGIAGKLALWEALRVVPEVARMTSIDLDVLEERARSQRERVESERLVFARDALAPGAAVQEKTLA
jgi:hypothetical protein